MSTAHHEPDKARPESKLAERKKSKPAKVQYYDDETGVKVQGPYHRVRTSGTISSFYVVTYYDPPQLRDPEHRKTEQVKTRVGAVQRGRQVATNLRAGAGADAAPNRTEPVRELVAVFLDPSRHPKGMRDGRPVGWSSTRTESNNRDTMLNWVVPIIGELRCELLGTKVGYDDGRWVASADGQLPIDHVLGAMGRAGLAASTRKTHLAHISGLLSFARDNGWLPPGCDPLDGVIRPLVSSKGTDLPDRWIDPETEVPTRLAINVLGEVYGDWHGCRSRWTEEYAWRWAQMPLVVAHTGPRLMEFLAWRASDWMLDIDEPYVLLREQLDRVADHAGYLRRRQTKHESLRVVQVVPWLVPTMQRLKELAVAAGGPDAPIWCALSDPTKHVRHDSFSQSYFRPQATEAHRRMVEMAKKDPSIRVGWNFVDVPQWQEPGVPKVNKRGNQIVRRQFDHTMKSLRHYFATWCLAPRADGGLDAPIKTVQRWMGHSSPQVTWEMYLAHEPGEVKRLFGRAPDDDRSGDLAGQDDDAA